jgi:hypothetical protein
MSASLLSLGVAALALVFAIVGAQRVLAASINADAFLAVLLKLCDATNFDRMRKLCVAAGPAVPGAVGARAMVDFCQKNPPQARASYRDESIDPTAPIRKELTETYEGATAPVLQRLSWAVVLWAASGVLVLGASLLHDPRQPHPQVEWWFQILLMVSLTISAWGGWTLHQLHEATARVLAGLLPPMARAWLDGRFQEIPPVDPRPPVMTTAPTAPGAPGSLRFEIHEPGSETRTAEIPRTPVLKIGRHNGSHIQLTHPSTARLHAVLEEQKDHWVIIDLGAPAGTVLNGEPVTKAEVRPGDTLLLGEVVVRLLP